MAIQRSEPMQRRRDLTRLAADSFDHPGLFAVPLDRPRAVHGATKTLNPPTMQLGGGRVGLTKRHKSGLHRYCSGCTHETEHVAWAADGRGSIPSIRWAALEPARDTTICLNCGQWRAATFQPRAPAGTSTAMTASSHSQRRPDR
jgi:hypothetical protein